MENKKRTAFILAAGLGTRLGKLTADKPKALAKVNGKPMLEHNVESLISQGFNHIVVNIHHFGNQIIDFFNEHNYDIKIDMASTKTLLGRYYISVENYALALIELQETLRLMEAYDDIILEV